MKFGLQDELDSKLILKSRRLPDRYQQVFGSVDMAQFHSFSASDFEEAFDVDRVLALLAVSKAKSAYEEQKLEFERKMLDVEERRAALCLEATNVSAVSMLLYDFFDSHPVSL